MDIQQILKQLEQTYPTETYLDEPATCYEKIRYSKDVDTLLIELSDEAIAYAEDEGRVILHYSNNEKLVLIEILDFKQFMSEDMIAELISTS